MRRRVTGGQAGEAADAIMQRRTTEDDPALERMPDDLLGLVNYVISNPAVASGFDERHLVRPGHAVDTVQRELRQADATDVLRILDYVDGWVDRYRLAAMTLGREQGWSWGDLAHAAGMRDRRYAESTYTRLYGQVKAGTGKHEKNARAARRRPAPPTGRRAAAPTRDANELDREMRRAIVELLAVKTLMPAGVGEDVADLRADLDRWPDNKPAPLELVTDLRLLLIEIGPADALAHPRLRAAVENARLMAELPAQD